MDQVVVAVDTGHAGFTGFLVLTLPALVGGFVPNFPVYALVTETTVSI